MTTKGQVTIPVEVRERLGIETGSRVHFVPHDDGSWEFVVSSGHLSSIRGMFASPRPRVSLDDMDDAVAEAATERYRDA